jgi:acetoin utilization deacetylase AcuC-like enzyme
MLAIHLRWELSLVDQLVARINMLHVVHHPDYVVKAGPSGGFSFDKYQLVMDGLADCGVAFTAHVPEPMPRRWIEAAHDPGYVAEVLAAAVPPDKERRIGFAVTPAVARRAVLTPGGTWLAASLAVEHGLAANMAGGSHHALKDSGAGYCVFNDLAIVARRWVAEDAAAHVLIVDLDVHQGDGTAMLTAGCDAITTFSMHGEHNFPQQKAVSSHDVALPDGIGDDDYLSVLAEHLPAVIERARPTLILYQAGVDPHRDDKFGRLGLSDEGLIARDSYVMDAARKRGLPLASTLGGGYGADPHAIARRHVATTLALAAANKVSTG